MNRAELKNDAKKKMEGNWKSWIYILLILFGIGLVVGIICAPISMNLSEDFKELPSSIITAVLNCLFGFGILSFFFKIAKGVKVEYSELYSKWKMGLKYFVMTLIIGIIVGVASVFLIIPGIILALGLSQVSLIILESPETGIFDAISKSWNMMKGHKWEYFVLELSFIG